MRPNRCYRNGCRVVTLTVSFHPPTCINQLYPPLTVGRLKRFRKPRPIQQLQHLKFQHTFLIFKSIKDNTAYHCKILSLACYAYFVALDLNFYNNCRIDQFSLLKDRHNILYVLYLTRAKAKIALHIIRKTLRCYLRPAAFYFPE